MTSENLNVAPYYDDFDEDKLYYRLLFRPTRAVQARELTQLQTLLQNQIKRFGQNIFKDGTVVVPGGISVDTQYEYVKLQDMDISTAIVGDTLTGQTSGNTATLLQKVDGDSVDPYTFYVQYTSGGRFADGEDIVASGTGSGTFTAEASNAVGTGTKVNLAKGIFFIKGFFVAAVSQSLIIEKYSTPTGTTEIGLVASESIVTADDDSSLFSNAAGTTNENAPGADRLKITATLIEKSDIEESNGETTSDYISLAIMQDEVIVEKFLTTQYNILGDELARRTFDESGNYTVDPFIIDVQDHDSDDTKLTLNIDPGVAYVRGYRIDKPTYSQIHIDKALTTETKENSRTSTNFGNYVRTSAPTHVPNFGTFAQVNLKSVGGTTIGTARVRGIERESASVYRIFLFDIQMSGANVFSSTTDLDDGTFSANLIDDADVALGTGDSAKLYSTDKNHLLFKIPQERVKDISDITVRVQRYETDTASGGAFTLDTGDANITWADTSNWIITNAAGAVVTATFGASGAQTILVSALAGTTDLHRVSAYVDKTSATTNRRTKTLTTKTDEPLSAATVATTEILLGESDIYDIVSIKDAFDDSDITDRYILDNGQRDNFYDEGKIILKTGETAPTGDTVSDVLVTFRYFEHGATGAYFNVDSYDGFVSGESYAEIPTHTLSTGEEIRLADAFDFRPRKDDTFANYSGAGSVVNELPKNNETILADVEYYLPRIDVVYIDQTGVFGVEEGTPDLNPNPNSIPTTAMSIYRLTLNAGTFDKSDVKLKFIENKRYTMRDIGAIESRIDRLEEWATLSLLEADTNTLQVLDNLGNNRFKSGFFVDNFNTHVFADTDSNEYKAAINISEGTLQPQFSEENVRHIYTATNSEGDASSNVVQKGDLIMLSYTEVVEITQPYATESINVNPYAIIVHVGSIELSPESDEWRDVINTTTTVNIENSGNGGVVDPNQQNNFGNWSWGWFGQTRTAGGVPGGTAAGRDAATNRARRTR